MNSLSIGSIGKDSVCSAVQTSFHKHPGLVVKNGLCFERPQATRRNQMVSVTDPDGNRKFVPPWVAFEKQVLRFFAKTEVNITESRSETKRIRYFTLLYYMEDGSISILAEKIASDGLPLGTILSRQQVDVPPIQKWTIGADIHIYGSVYNITSMDRFTSDYFASLGIDQPLVAENGVSRPIDNDPTTVVPSTHTGNELSRKTVKFLSNDRKVCRFYAKLANDSDENRRFIILFYLADDTVEIREEFGKNSGRDEISILFNRGKIYSDGSPVIESNPRDSNGHLFDLQSFRVGRVIRLVFAEYIVTGCDKFTRDWFAANFNIDVGPDEPIAEVNRAPAIPEKHMKKQPVSHDPVILRCVCRKTGGPPEDRDRKFILSFFLDSREVSIYEPPIRNSGVVGGRFLERGEYDQFKLSGPDFVVGKEFCVLGHTFVIEEVDKRSEEIVHKLSLPVLTIAAVQAPDKPLKTRRIRELFETRPGFDCKLMKELSNLTLGANKASPVQLARALSNLGQTVSMEEIHSCVESKEAFDIFAFIHSMKRSNK